MLLISLDSTVEQLDHRPADRKSFSGKADVAKLRTQDVAKLARDDLISAICAADMPYVSQDSKDRLQFCDREILTRLAFLARRSCRNQGY